MGSKFLIAEDEEIISRELKTLLGQAGYQAVLAEDFQGLLPQIQREQPDLVLLDVNLPGCSGFDICAQIQEHAAGIPVIFLTSRTDSMDELTGMLKGGDDYITKPYQGQILLARIGAVLRRTKGVSQQENTRFSWKGVGLDIAGCLIYSQGGQAELTKNEMKIMHRLFLHPGQYVPRVELVEYLWENQIFIDDNALSVHITRIREKLRAVGVHGFIETKRGMGYRI